MIRSFNVIFQLIKKGTEVSTSSIRKWSVIIDKYGAQGTNHLAKISSEDAGYSLRPDFSATGGRNNDKEHRL
jgi:hypothetical protein